jgi:sugar phosphate isomerase/epimerase
VENLSEQAADFGPAFSGAQDLGMTLDIGHGELLSKKNTAYDFLAQYPEKIYHMHVHDNHGGSAQTDDLHLPPGKGTIDFASILRAAAGQGYSRTMTAEVDPPQAPQACHYIRRLWNTVNPP